MGRPANGEVRSVTIECLTCSRPVRTKLSRLARGMNIGKWCSVLCRSDWCRLYGNPNSYASAPRSKGHTRYHRVVAEQFLGRKLYGIEVVHHINGCKRDNKPSNLIVCASRREHNFIHRKPRLISFAVWLGVPGNSVRYLDHVSSLAEGGMECCSV